MMQTAEQRTGVMNIRSLRIRGAAGVAEGFLLLGVAGTAMADNQQGTGDVDIALLATSGSHSSGVLPRIPLGVTAASLTPQNRYSCRFESGRGVAVMRGLPFVGPTPTGSDVVQGTGGSRRDDRSASASVSGSL